MLLLNVNQYNFTDFTARYTSFIYIYKTSNGDNRLKPYLVSRMLII